MWSLACIISELQIGYPIFAGENEQDQMSFLMEILGVPEGSILEVFLIKRESHAQEVLL